jgi:hypothetical protein
MLMAWPIVANGLASVPGLLSLPASSTHHWEAADAPPGAPSGIIAATIRADRTIRADLEAMDGVDVERFMTPPLREPPLV